MVGEVLGRKSLSSCMDRVDRVKGTARKGQVSVEVSTKYGFDGSFGDGLFACECVNTNQYKVMKLTRHVLCVIKMAASS